MRATLLSLTVVRALAVVIASCTSSGRVVVSSVQGDACRSNELLLDMMRSDERVTAVHASSSSFVLGTSHGEIIVVQRHGSPLTSHLTAYRLQQRSGLIVGVIQTGFKLLGLATDESRGEIDCVSKVLTVPGTQWLLKCGDDLRLWDNWAESGREVVVWESSLVKVLSDDMPEVEGRIRVHDVILLPFAGQAVLSLAVLSSVPNPSSSDTSLFLHMIDASLTATAMPLMPKAHIVVDALSDLEHLEPAILEETATSRAQIFWSSAVTHTVHSLSLDLRAVRLIHKTIDLSPDIADFDIDLPSSHVKAVNSIVDEEGLFVLTSDGMLRHHSTLFVDVNSPPRLSSQSMNLKDYILGICGGEVSQYSHISRLI